MLIYIIVFFIAIYSASKAEYAKNNIKIIIWSCVSILLPSILAGIRDSGVGYDTEVYANLHFATMQGYHFYNTQSFIKYLVHGEFGGEWVYAVLTYLSVRLGGSLNWFYFILNLFVCLFTYLAIYDHRKKASMAFMMFIFLFSFYNISYNIMRQCLALSLSLYSYKYYERKQWKILFSLILVILFSHGSGIFYVLVLICIWIQDYYRLSPIKNMMIFLLIPLSFVYFDLILQKAAGFGLVPEKYAELYSTDDSSGGFMKVHVLIAVFEFMLLFISSIISKKSYPIKLVVNNQLLYTLFLLTMTISLWAFRISYYFYYLNILLIPLAVRNLSRISQKNAIVVKYITILLILIEWLYCIVIANENSTVPYKSVILNNLL